MIIDTHERILLWQNEVQKIAKQFPELLEEFDFILVSCSMEIITFRNTDFTLRFLYAYERYQMESNLQMPLAMISFGNEKKVMNLIDIFKVHYTELNFYKLMGEINAKTNDQSVTYQLLVREYVLPLLRSKTLMNL